MANPTPLSLHMARRLLAVLAVASLAVGASSNGGDGTTSSTTTSSTTTTTTVVEAEEPSSDVGVDLESQTITLGVLADLSGPYASLTSDIVDAHRVYWDALNEMGGIDGWTVDVVVEDTRNDPEQHRVAYEAVRNEVLAISAATGSSTNVALLDAYAEDRMVVIPASWYSGWPFQAVDRRVILEMNTNYCLEAMNVAAFIAENQGTSVAIVTLDDVYGRDAAAGLKLAADHHGLVVAYDGTGAVSADSDLTEVIGAVAESGAEWTFLATNPSISAQIMAGAARFGYEGLFIGSAPSYDSRLLDSASAELFDTRFFHSAYVVPWGADVPGNLAMMNAVSKAYPDRRPSDTFIVGWNAAVAMRAVLAQAISLGNLTRAGIVTAANTLDEVDFGGAAPTQSYTGEPDEFVVRESAIYTADLDAYLSAGGVEQTVSQPDATTGSVAVEGFTAAEPAASFRFVSPCFIDE